MNNGTGWVPAIRVPSDMLLSGNGLGCGFTQKRKEDMLFASESAYVTE